MTMTDPLGDMLTRIRNAQMRRKQFVVTPNSKLRAWVLDVLKSEGYIKSYEIEKTPSGIDTIKVSLKYFDGEPVIKELKRVSTPGRRVYLGVDNLPKVRQGLGVAVVSTSKGIMSDSQARQSRVGGEVLCTVF
jgi:small subunit ribosomal protein S8